MFYPAHEKILANFSETPLDILLSFRLGVINLRTKAFWLQYCTMYVMHVQNIELLIFSF